jgi:DNA-binding NarL/FixJ family response regulator
MPNTRKNILFIDDECEAYLPALNPAAFEAGFVINVSKSIADGKGFLHSHASVVDAIILDLLFPANETQGMEGLRDIVRLFPHIPVIILTDSDSTADLGIVVECMKLGAYNYVGKSNLNPVYLFQVISKAVDDYRRKKYVHETKKTSDNKELFHTVIQKYPKDSNYYQAIFGFELVSVSKIAGKDTSERLLKKANSWHQKLLKAINTPYKDSIKINLRYITNGNKKVTCRIFFSVYDDTPSKLSNLVRTIQEDIKLLFSQDSQSNNRVYSFNNITEDRVLTDSLNYGNDRNYFVTCRKPASVNLSNQIGFATDNRLSDNMNLIFPLEPPSLDSNEFIKALATSNQSTEIDIELHARNLKIYEIDFLKSIISYPNSIKPATYGSKGELWLKQHLNSFIERADEKCFISLVIIQKNDSLNHNLKTAISDSFLGSGAIFRAKRPENLIRFAYDTDQPENQLPFCYSLNQLLHAFRLPLPDEESIEGINLQPATFTFLPDNLPGNGFRLGEKHLFNGKKEIRADASILSRHLYIMGQTGTGKTTLLKTMISDCIDQNKGFALIDPHGDLFQEIRNNIPDEKKQKTIIIDTVNPEKSARYNPLLYDSKYPQTKSLIINELLRIADNLYNLKETGGPMFELYFRHGLLLTMDDKVQESIGQSNLETFIKIFYSAGFCKELIDVCGNSKTVEFFNNALNRHGESAYENIAPYITSKMTRFTDDMYIQQIIKSDSSCINFRQLIDDEYILLVKMDKGLIGSSNASLLGQLIISSILMAATSRSDIAPADRKPFYLFIDEFQNFIQGDIATALAEARKYNLRLTMANQTLGQLNKHVLESLLGNVGSFLFFRPGINDYDMIRHYIEPEFERRDVLKLPNFNCISRLLIDNIPSDPFLFQTIK